MLLLTGLLALVEPGQLLQLFAGVVTAFGFNVVQLLCAPYTQPSNNLLAACASSGITLHLLGCLGLQFNAEYERSAIETWISTRAADMAPLTSPMTGLAMGATITPNRSMRSMLHQG